MYLGDAAPTVDPAMTDLYNQQIASFQQPILDAIANVTATKSALDVANFRYNSARALLSSQLSDWVVRVAQVSSNPGWPSYINYIIATNYVLQPNADLSVNGLQSGMLTFIGGPVATLASVGAPPANDPGWAALATFANSIAPYAKKYQDANTALSQASIAYQAALGAQSQLQSTITQWLNQAAQANMGPVLTYDELVTQAQSVQLDHPISAVSVDQAPPSAMTPPPATVTVTASNPNLLYLGAAALGLLILMRR